MMLAQNMAANVWRGIFAHAWRVLIVGYSGIIDVAGPVNPQLPCCRVESSVYLQLSITLEAVFSAHLSQSCIESLPPHF